MNTAPASPLLRHLALVLAIKLALLTALWWAFVRDLRVPVDVPQIERHLAAPAAQQGAAR